MKTKPVKTLSAELEAKLSQIALKHARLTAFKGHPEEVGLLFLRLRKWHLNHPGQDITDVQIFDMCKCLRIETLRRETKMDRKTKKSKMPTVTIASVTEVDGRERQSDYPKILTEDNAAAERDHADFVRLLKKLPARSKKILELRSEGYSLAEIGETIGLTLERVRQLAAEAVEKMRELARK